MAFKTAPAPWMDGVTVATADITNNAVTLGKTSSLKGLYQLHGYQAAGAAASHLIRYQAYGAAQLLEVGVSLKSAAGTGTSVVLNVLKGAGATASTAVATLSVKAGSTLKVAAIGATSGVIADNGTVVVNVKGVTSTCTGLNAWLWAKQALTQ
jgi:hypothetical protein